MEEWSRLCKVEPYYFFLFRHWEEFARANPGFNGEKVQELLWRRWSSLQDEVKSKQQKDNKTNVRKRRREARSLKSTTTRPAVGGPKTFWEDQRAGDLKKRSPTSKFTWFLRFLHSAVGGPKQILRTGPPTTPKIPPSIFFPRVTIPYSYRP